MENFLISIGWWNFIGSIFMLSLLNESLGKLVLNDWTKIFIEEYKVSYWSKLWLVWLIGLNIFYGLINVYVVKWGNYDFKYFVTYFDFFAYLFFLFLTFKLHFSRKCGIGVYIVFAIFIFWASWAVYVIQNP